MPRPIKKRITKPTASQEDVQDTLSKLAAAAGAKKKQVTVAIIALLCILLIATGAFLFNKNASERAAHLEAEGYKMFNGLYESESIPLAERLELALTNFRDSNATSPTAFRHYYIAATLTEMGRYDEALGVLGEVEKKYSTNMTILPIVKLKKAQLFKKTGQNEQALAVLQEYNYLSAKTLKDFAIMETANLLEELGRADEAQPYYSLLLRDHPDSQFASLATAKMQTPQFDGTGIVNGGDLSVPLIK